VGFASTVVLAVKALPARLERFVETLIALAPLIVLPPVAVRARTHSRDLRRRRCDLRY
jgi:hypothetical protein